MSAPVKQKLTSAAPAWWHGVAVGGPVVVAGATSSPALGAACSVAFFGVGLALLHANRGKS